MAEQNKIPRYDKASLEEINALKKLVKKLKIERESVPQPTQLVPSNAPSNILFDNLPPTQPPPPPITKTPAQARLQVGRRVSEQQFRVGNLFEGGIANVEITREPVKCDNPVTWLLWLMPELEPYKWQYETLLQTAGYLTPGKYGPNDKTPITVDNPFLFAGPMANGSGKDLVLIAAFATWFPVIAERNRVVITSASHEQIKYQTEVHIRNLCTRANEKFGQLFKSVEFHHIVPELGSEIKLYATDEAGRAEGYHAFHGGQLAVILNEAKSIKEDINVATERYRGLTHRLEISSPGQKSGFFYSNVKDENTIHYPAPVKLGTYYTRKVTAFDCPHIPASLIERLIHKYGADSLLVMSSIFADFCDLDSPVVITEFEYEQWINSKVEPVGDDIGIGLDIAAGGDEDACFVRKGNKIVHSFFFRQPNVITASELIDQQLLPWKDSKYTFRADNGGVGMGCIDNLTKLGWKIVRTNNQSPARDKRQFLNLGAEQWYHLKRLLARKDIVPYVVDKLKTQLTSRYWRGLDSTQGKLALESKQEAKASGRPSPDRADAYVLCNASYRPRFNPKPQVSNDTVKNLMNVHEYLQKLRFGMIQLPGQNNNAGRFTLLTRKLH